MKLLRVIRALLVLLLAGTGSTLWAEGEVAGDFDYYVLALSWSPAWCATDPEAPATAECADATEAQFVVHGLWPQYDAGWPSYCGTSRKDPSRADTAAMADVMGSAGNAWHQWKKHGRCSGLTSEDYFATLQRARAAITIPPLFGAVEGDRPTSPEEVTEAFLAANPALSGGDLAVTCNAGLISEVRLCLTTDLQPRPCGADVARRCDLPRATLKGLP